MTEFASSDAMERLHDHGLSDATVTAAVAHTMLYPFADTKEHVMGLPRYVQHLKHTRSGGVVLAEWLP